MDGRSGFDQVDRLFMDLVGGSVEITYANSNEENDYHIVVVEAAKSMSTGAAKLTGCAEYSQYRHYTEEDLRTSMKEMFGGMRKFPQLKSRPNISVVLWYTSAGVGSEDMEVCSCIRIRLNPTPYLRLLDTQPLDTSLFNGGRYSCFAGHIALQ